MEASRCEPSRNSLQSPKKNHNNRNTKATAVPKFKTASLKQITKKVLMKSLDYCLVKALKHLRI